MALKDRSRMLNMKMDTHMVQVLSDTMCNEAVENYWDTFVHYYYHLNTCNLQEQVTVTSNSTLLLKRGICVVNVEVLY